MKRIITPILLITVGIAWLLSAMDVIPQVNWVWVLGLGVSGILVLVVGGITKTTFVVGPTLIICSVFSILRQMGKLSPNYEVPILVIIIGVLMLLASVLPLPDSKSSN
jgi:hypothetical protein